MQHEAPPSFVYTHYSSSFVAVFFIRLIKLYKIWFVNDYTYFIADYEALYDEIKLLLSCYAFFFLFVCFIIC